jgi:glycerate-2-kinase
MVVTQRVMAGTRRGKVGAMLRARDVANQAYLRAIAEARADRLVRAALARIAMPQRGATLLAAGKASLAMAAAAVEAWGDAIRGGVVVTKHVAPVLSTGVDLDVRVAGHPVPDERSVAAARELLARAAGADCVLALISGGASALAALPAPGVPLEDKIAVTRALAAAGASIQELNTVRKHLSSIKGGRLAAAARGRVIALLLSDVIGDDPSTIGGGLVAPDRTTCEDALAILAARGVAPPAAVRARLERGARERAARPLDMDVETHVIGGPGLLVDGAIAGAQVAVSQVRRGFTGTVEELADWLAAAEGTVVVGGEPTIRLPPDPGRGGRAQHAALLCARALARTPPPADLDVAILCGASDGTDGPTDDAGGLVDAGTWGRAAAAGVDPDAALAAYDAGRALAAAGDLVTTGPTGTNVCDVFVKACLPRA